MLFSTSVECTVTFTGGGIVLTVMGCGVRGLPEWGSGTVLTELSGGVVLVVNVGMVVEGVVVFKVLVWGMETFPGAGGDAVFRALIREVGILPPAGGGEAVLESF